MLVFGGGDLTGALHDIVPVPVVTTASIILCFDKHRPTRITWKMAVKMESV